MKKFPALAIAILLAGFGVSAQDASPKSNSGNGEVYKVGGDVSAPKAIYAPDPEYSDKARKKKKNGSVILSVVVGTDGLPRDIKVKNKLGYDLDKNAVETLKKWRFTPAMRNGQPVAVALDVEMTFRVY